MKLGPIFDKALEFKSAGVSLFIKSMKDFDVGINAQGRFEIGLVGEPIKGMFHLLLHELSCTRSREKKIIRKRMAWLSKYAEGILHKLGYAPTVVLINSEGAEAAKEVLWFYIALTLKIGFTLQ